MDNYTHNLETGMFAGMFMAFVAPVVAFMFNNLLNNNQLLIIAFAGFVASFCVGFIVANFID